MAIFSYLYDKMLNWSRHRHAPYYLGGISFAESSFFPLAPDIMLAPMALANPQRAWLYAGITTLASTLGGIFGYIIDHEEQDDPFIEIASDIAGATQADGAAPTEHCVRVPCTPGDESLPTSQRSDAVGHPAAASCWNADAGGKR